MACLVCGSTIYHFAKDYPVSFDSYNKKKDKYISVYSDTMKHLVGETLSTSVLDSACTTNVCDETWLSCSLDTLGSSDLKLYETYKGSTKMKFWNGEEVQSLKLTKIAVLVRVRKFLSKKTWLDATCTYFWAKEQWKKRKMSINFSTYLVNVFRMKHKLQFTGLGHYWIPIRKHVQSSNCLRSRNFEKTSIVLFGD